MSDYSVMRWGPNDWRVMRRTSAIHRVTAERHTTKRGAYAALRRLQQTQASRDPSERTVKVTQTPIAYWDPTTKKGGRLTVYRSESTRSGTSFSYKGDGSSGHIRASTNAEAIAYVESVIVPMQQGRLKRAAFTERDRNRR